MTTVADVLQFLDTLAPPSLKMEWDHIGLQCGSRQQTVSKILVALDPFFHVCQEAAALGADLLVTHHPLIFHPLEALTDETSTARCAMLLCQNGISSIHAHTNLDCAPGGVNDVLAATLGLKDVQTIGSDNLLRAGYWDASLPEFLAHVKAALDCQGLRYVSGGRPVHKVAVGGGSCAGEMAAVLAAGCDTFVTADAKYNQFWDAREQGLNLIDAGHFQTENPVCRYLVRQLQDAFPSLQVQISETHRDCMNFF